MTRIAVHVVSLALVFFLFPSSSAGPACARKHLNSVDGCIASCRSKWGFPKYAVGSDRWGVVLKPTTDSVEEVAAKACGSSSTSMANSTSSTKAPAFTIAGAAALGPQTITSSSTSSISSVISSSSSVPPPSSSSVVSSAKFTTLSSPAAAEQRVDPSTTQEPATTPKPTPTSTPPPKPTPSAAPPPPKPTTLAAPPPPKPAPVVNTPTSSGGTSASDKAAYLSAHNDFRAQHGAGPLTFDDELAAAAQKWANNCKFEHSGGSLGPFGENLAAGTGSGYGIAQAIKGWTDESKDYNPANPTFSHFTQVVWKATTKVGCAVASCDGIFDTSFGKARYYVCEYSKQGNVAGQFAANVQA